MALEFRNRLAEWLLFSVSHEGAAKIFAKGFSFLKICLKLEESPIHIPGKLLLVVSRRPQSLAVLACPWRHGCPPDVAAISPRMSHLPDTNAFCEPISAITHHHFHPILFVKSKLLKPTHIQGKGKEVSHFRGRSSQEFVDVFKTNTAC